MRLRCNRRSNMDRGVTAVEFAVVAPIFFFLLFGAMEFASAGSIRNTAHNAAYEAARLIVVPGASSQQGVDEARRIMSVIGVRNLTVNVTPAVIDEKNQEITVDITIPYQQNAIIAPWFLGDLTIRSTCRLKAERYNGF